MHISAEGEDMETSALLPFAINNKKKRQCKTATKNGWKRHKKKGEKHNEHAGSNKARYIT